MHTLVNICTTNITNDTYKQMFQAYEHDYFDIYKAGKHLWEYLHEDDFSEQVGLLLLLVEGRESVRVAYVSRKRVPDSLGLKFERMLAKRFGVCPWDAKEPFSKILRAAQ